MRAQSGDVTAWKSMSLRLGRRARVGAEVPLTASLLLAPLTPPSRPPPPRPPDNTLPNDINYAIWFALNALEAYESEVTYAMHGSRSGSEMENGTGGNAAEWRAKEARDASGNSLPYGLLSHFTRW